MHACAEQSAARRTAANQITVQLIARTITLPVATDELIEVYREDMGMNVVLETIHPGAHTARERFARHAIDRACGLLRDDPAQRDAVVAHLEAEYRAMCASPESPHTH